MDSFEMNKMIGALLAVVFIVFSISIVSEAIFASPTPETFGYAIEAAEPDAGAASEAGPAEAPIAARLQTATPEAGEQLFKRCAACHTDDAGGANKIGPNLWGVVNRPVASHEGFSYSAAMREHAQTNPVWDYDHLDQFIAAPKAVVRGTAMSYAGLKNPEDRANLIAYLRTTADTPEPLPEAPAAEAEATPIDSGANAQGETPVVEGGAQPTQMANPPGVEGSAASESTGAPLPQTPAVEIPDGEAPTANPSSPDVPEHGAGAPNNTEAAPAQSAPQPGEAVPAQEGTQTAPAQAVPGLVPAEGTTGTAPAPVDPTNAPVETDGGAPANGAAPFQGDGQGN
ncbi:MAG TPA: c-type cytochrome [Tianweitania sediminis]|jgi:cytochrome c|nr:c-type cytochrome [Tianweitania sediminis]